MLLFLIISIILIGKTGFAKEDETLFSDSDFSEDVNIEADETEEISLVGCNFNSTVAITAETAENISFSGSSFTDKTLINIEESNEFSLNSCNINNNATISFEHSDETSFSLCNFNNDANINNEKSDEISFNNSNFNINTSINSQNGNINFNDCNFSDGLNVLDFGAVPDGETDNKAAFQSALNKAVELKSYLVYVPSGNYLFKGHIDIPIGVALKGTRASVPASNGIRDSGLPLPTEGGSTLMPTENANNEDGEPFITLNTNSTLSGFVIYYPEQKVDDIPIPYPWSVAMRGKNPAILDCELLNSYNGIDASQNERHLVRNISGQPLRRGIFTDYIYDIGRWENIHWNPWFSMKEKLWEWQLQNGEGFIFGKSDWHYVINCFCYGYAVGYKFIETEYGTCNGNFVGLGADGCNKSILIEAANPMGLLFTNGEFVAMFGEDPVMIDIPETNTDGVVMFENCSFWGPCHQNAVIKSGEVTFNNCNFLHWDTYKKGVASIDIQGGNVIISNSRFQEDKTPISISKKAKALIYTSNIFKTEKEIINNSSAKISEGFNIFGL